MKTKPLSCYARRLFFVLVVCPTLWGVDTLDLLMKDLRVAKEVAQSLEERLPLVYNSSLQVGYLNMPSARMHESGTVALAFTHLPPYRIISAHLQPFSRIELSANYRIFHGQKEWHMSQYGFGDDADRGINAKLLLLSAQDGSAAFPEIAFGAEDFYGSKRFNSLYLVATKQWLALNVETTIGYGWRRFKGAFGAISWTPFRRSTLPFIRDLTLLAEYDPIDYANNPGEHDRGKEVASRINVGISATLCDVVQAKVGTQRGKEIAAQVSLNYNLGESKGLFAKTEDPPLYTKPVDSEPIGPLRVEKELAQEFAYAFAQQGLTLASLHLVTTPKRSIWLKLINMRYRDQHDVKNRVENLLAGLTPDNVAEVTVVIESHGIPVQEYVFRFQDLARFRRGTIGRMELDALSPIRNPTAEPSKYDGVELYQRRKPIWSMVFRPRLLSFFGSSRGKYKYSFGLLGGVNGYLFDQLYYDTLVSYTITSTVEDIQDRDFYNPSKLINVRSDAVRYFQQHRWSLERAYLQKGWHLGNGYFCRLAGGYFEPMYGGLAVEGLYYPAGSSWAVGLEAASVLKRNFSGLGFTRRVRKFEGATPDYVRFIGVQYFLNLYYYFTPLNMEFSVKAGQFLARDKGARFEASRYYPSGMKVSFWYTLTNARDVVNNRRYHDRGVALSFPLDIFMKKSSRRMLGYAMSFWLRDTGAIAQSGKALYPTINQERRGYIY